MTAKPITARQYLDAEAATFRAEFRTRIIAGIRDEGGPAEVVAAQVERVELMSDEALDAAADEGFDRALIEEPSLVAEGWRRLAAAIHKGDVANAVWLNQILAEKGEANIIAFMQGSGVDFAALAAKAREVARRSAN